MVLLKLFEKLGKKILVSFFGLFYSPDQLQAEDINLEYIKRILVVRPDNRIGNLVLLTPLLAAIKVAFPQSYLSLLVGEEFADVLSENPDINELIIVNRKSLIRNPFRLFKLSRKLKTDNYDLAIDASHMHSFSLTSGYLTHLSKAPIRLGYQRGHSHLFFNIQVPPIDENRHEIDIQLNLLRFLVSEVDLCLPKVIVKDSDKDYASRVVAIKGVSRNDILVGIHIGGRRGKRWLVEKFAILTDRLINDYGVKVMIFYGLKERNILSIFLENVHTSPIILGLEPFGRFTALIERCDYFIVGDTGPMHVAVAIGVPTIALFLVDNYRRYGPRGSQHRIVFSSDGNVEVDDVLYAFEDLRKQIESQTESEEDEPVD